MRYIISEKATEDLEQIWRHTYFQWSESQADKYYNLLIDKIEFIAQNAAIGRRIDDIKTGYRYFPAGSHVIFYKISEDSIVTIIRILHRRMDIPEHLRE
jgi:toxin ParE1/3/4